MDPLRPLLAFLTLIVLSTWHGDGTASPLAPAEVQSARTSGKIAEGSAWETAYHVVDSGLAGPTVLLVGGMHGNEPAGAVAAEQILQWPITRGRLIVVPRANVLALQANTRLTPGHPREEGNLNRNFPRAGQPDKRTVQARGELAGALWRFVAGVRPDWIIDLHEGFDFHRSHRPPEGSRRSVGSSIIYRGSAAMDPLARQVVAAADATVSDPDRRFSLLRGGPVSTGLVSACIDVLGARGVILETTFKEQPLSLRVRQHRSMVNVLLNHVGLLDRDCHNLLAPPRPEEGLRIGLFDGAGTGSSRQTLRAVIAAAPNLALSPLGPEDMRVASLEQFDVLVFPGGSGSKQAAALGREGREAVRTFVRAGGGVVGVCAGAYLCSAHYDWSLDLVDSRVLTGKITVPGKGVRQLWYRGKATPVAVELTRKGASLFGPDGIPDHFDVRYANGPIVSPANVEELADYQVLAWFRSETGLWEQQKGTMVDTPAIVSGAFGRGRVVSVSPHPEFTPALHPIITRSIQWSASAARGSLDRNGKRAEPGESQNAPK